MKQIKTFSDQRLYYMCSYCGKFPETKDHVPSKILLDDPFTYNLPVVPCCQKCNQDFSLDEEYVACAIECIINGTTEIEKLKREKIKSILSKREVLRQRIENSFIIQSGNKNFQIEEDRLRKVIIKLAKGHAKYENSEPIFEEPTKIWIKPLVTMTEEETDVFFATILLNNAPEMGSRSMQNLYIDCNNNVLSQWITVQENNYQYLVCMGIGFLIVKIVIWNYLAIEVTWFDYI